MLKNYLFLVLLALIAIPRAGLSQEIDIFTVSDFDLNGQVKSCKVSTDYGKEEYQFDVSGRLIEAITRYNEQDFDLTIYKYDKNELVEKRVEIYRENNLDAGTSIANFYTYDSSNSRRVTEKIISYEKEFLEQYVYSYSKDKKLAKIVRSNNDGIDETSVVYFKKDDSSNANYILNREIQKSVKTKINTLTDSTFTKTIRTKTFLSGTPTAEIEEVYNTMAKLSSRAEYSYDSGLEKFIPKKRIAYSYDEKGTLLKTETKTANELSIKEYLYQNDNYGNWIKQIVTPDNRYKTRAIRYYKTQESTEQEE